MTITFIPVDDTNRRETLDFLAQHENTCITLCENVRRKTADIFIIKTGEHIYGIISARHTVLHCLPGIDNAPYAEALSKALEVFLSIRKVSCINGESSGSQFLMHILASKNTFPAQINHYSLMTLPGNTISSAKAKQLLSALPAGFHMIHAHAGDAETLMALQAAYEKEEVIPPCRTFLPAVIRQNLDYLLTADYVLALRNDKSIFVSKANTNAIGIHCVQIGGVYTMPEYRRRHFAAILVSALVDKIISVKKDPVLFVKNSNSAAKMLYSSLGFMKSSDFIIAYF